jgi:hypothetical protein
MKSRLTLAILTLALAAVLPFNAIAQNVSVDRNQPNLLLAAVSTMTLQQELDKAGALGFHTLLATTRGNGEMVVLLERDIRATQRYQFVLIATNATGTFQKEIADAAANGYRANGKTFLNKGGEIVVVMERPENVAPTKIYEYKILATNQTSSLEKEWISSLTETYTQVGMLTRTEVMLLMERESRVRRPSSTAPPRGRTGV